jgi:hypothetical protein
MPTVLQVVRAAGPIRLGVISSHITCLALLVLSHITRLTLLCPEQVNDWRLCVNRERRSGYRDLRLTIIVARCNMS